MAFGQDLSKQRHPPCNMQVEQELHVAKSLLDRAIDAIFWVAPNARFFYVNHMACRWLGYSREELLCLSVHDVAPDLSVEVWSQQWRSLQQHGCLTFESQYRTKAGEFLPVEVSFTYGLIQDREFGCAFARARRQEVELNRVLEQEKKCSQLRAEFICMLSHEIRMSLHLISFSTIAIASVVRT